MADRELRVLILGDSTSLQAATVKADVAVASLETQLKGATALTAEFGLAQEGLMAKSSALAGLGLTPATVGLLGLTVGLGVAVEGGKMMIDNAEKNEIAQRGLEQAFASQKLKLDDYQKTIQTFLDTNARYIHSEYEAKDSIAAFTRAGFDQTTVMRLTNDALDLAAIKHISLSDATTTLIKAEQGRFRGLIDLGISIKGVTAGNVDQVASQERIKEAITETEVKIKDGRKATSELTQSQDALNHKTEEFSNKYGPALVNALADGVDIISLTIDAWGIFGNKMGGVLAQIGSAITNAPTTPQGGRGSGRAPAQASGGSFVPSSMPSYTAAVGIDDTGPRTVNVTQHISGPDPVATAAAVNAGLSRAISS